MNHWHYFIDETGTFQHHRINPNSTNNWLVALRLQRAQISELYQHLQNLSAQFEPARQIQWNMEGFHAKDIYQNQGLATVYPKVYEILEQMNCLIYRTIGEPEFPIDPEDSWYQIALSMIAQIAKEELRDHPNAQLEFHLPSRNYWMHFVGSYQIGELAESQKIEMIKIREKLLVARFDKDLAKVLTQTEYAQVKVHSRYTSPYILPTSTVSDAAIQAGLAMADAAIYWIRSSNHGICAINPQNTKTLNFVEEFTPSRHQELLQRIPEDPENVFLQALNGYIKRPSEQEIWTDVITQSYLQIVQLYSQNPDLLEWLCSTIAHNLETSIKSVNKPNYRQLDHLCKLLENLNVQQSFPIFSDRWRYALIKTMAQIENHMGKIQNATAMNKWWSEVISLNPKIFDDSLRYQQEKVEVVLFRAQQHGINTLSPESVEQSVIDCMNEYVRYMPAHCKQDRHYARLVGTLAQIQAFKAGWAKSPLREQLLDQAWRNFRIDLQFCPPQGFETKQAQGYLNATAFHQGNASLLRSQLVKLTEIPDEALLDFGYQIAKQQNAYNLLHRLYLWQLEKTNAVQVTGVETLLEHLEKALHDKNQHPFDLIVKWVAVLCQGSEHAQRATQLLQNSILHTKERGFGLEMIRWVNAKIHQKITGQTIACYDEICAKIHGDTGIYGALDQIEYLGKEKFEVQSMDELGLEQWALLMPFHFC